MDHLTLHRPLDSFNEYFSILDRLRSEGQVCDVILVVDNVEIQAHKLILATFSPYFLSMFKNFAIAKKRIVLEKIDRRSLQALIDYMYKSKITVTEDILQDLLITSKQLQMMDVFNLCVDFLKGILKPEKCLGISAFAKQNGCVDLEPIVNNYVRYNFTRVVMSEEFLSLTAERVIELISSDYITTQSEEEVFECVILWVNNNLPERKGSFLQLLKNVRIPLLTKDYIESKVYTEPLITENSDCMKFVHESCTNYSSLNTKHRCNEKVIVFVRNGWQGKARKFECLNLRLNKLFEFIERKDRRYKFVIAAIDSTVYLIGGYINQKITRSITEYECHRNYWSYGVPMTIKREYCSAAASPDKRIYVVGGYNGSEYLKSAEVFDTKSRKWNLIAEMPTGRSRLGLCFINGLLYAVGGYKGQLNTHVTSNESYCPRSNRWSILPDAPRERHCEGVAGLNGILYVVGGMINGSSSRSCDAYNPNLRKWKSIADMKDSRYSHGLVAVNNLLYAVGGYTTGHKALESIEVYDPIVNTWTLFPNIAYPRGSYSGVVVDNQGYIKEISLNPYLYL